ncbi:MAG: Ku protein [Thermoleophilaceae bacterium]
MASSLWSGALSFGLVNVPIQLVTATQDREVRFHQLHDRDGVRIQTRRVCPADGEEVPFDRVARGYEVAKEHYVTVTDDELDSLAPKKTHTIDLEAFVGLAEIDPVRFDHAYYVLPQGDSTATQRAYRLLQQVMAETGRVALGRFVLRAKEYLVAIRPLGKVMVLHTMVFEDELVPRLDLLGPEADETPVESRQLEAMGELIGALSSPFEPERYPNRRRDAVLALIEQKVAGEETISAPEPPTPEPVPDLMAALEATLRDVRAREPAPKQAEATRRDLV